MRIKTSKALFLASIVAAFSAGPVAAGTYNPTASDSKGNTAGGTSALPAPSANGANFNTAFGAWSLGVLTSGSSDTAFGSSALGADTTGMANTAVGGGALGYDTTGSNNTAVGVDALFFVSTGQYNTGTGSMANAYNNGSGNTATGYGAMGGPGVLYGISQPPPNVSSYNTATGYYSLIQTTSGGYNVGEGAWSQYNTTSGTANIGVGAFALYSNTSGSNNIGIGEFADYYSTTGSYNIDIGNYGQSGESNTMRLGSSGSQTRTFIAGISGVNLNGGGSEVYINSSGQLGTVNSSARYKQDIADMAGESSALSKLRPVTFSYKSDPAHEKQYGLIAEEVAEVYPNLVVRNAEGQIESVRYYELAPMLLNEVQKQQKTIQDQQLAIQQLSERLAKLESRQ